MDMELLRKEVEVSINRFSLLIKYTIWKVQSVLLDKVWPGHSTHKQNVTLIFTANTTTFQTPVGEALFIAVTFVPTICPLRGNPYVIMVDFLLDGGHDLGFFH